MKTYKEINEAIIVPEELKEKTLHQMKKHRKIRQNAMLRFAVICIFLLALGGSAAFYRQMNSPQIQEEKTAFKLADYVQEFDVDKAKTDGRNSAMEIAGGLYNMNRKLLEKTVDEVPSLAQIEFPKGYEAYMRLREYRNDETSTGPFAVVWYMAEKGDKFIYAEISDKNMPRCMAGFDPEEKGWKTYKDYSLDITHRKTEGGESYWVSAKRKHFIIEINAVVESSKDFEAFLDSFLI